MMASCLGVTMAHKVPVGGTITHAYRFAFGNILNNLGAMWIPAVILYATNFVLSAFYRNVILSAGNPQVALAGLYLFIIMIVFGILSAAQIGGITKEALGLRTGNAWLQFPFGAVTWRLVGAYLLYFVVLIVLYIGVFVVSLLFAGIAAGAAATGSTNWLLPGAGIVAVILKILMLCALLYVATRLSFLLGPVVVAEHKISLIRAWELSKGNFWQIFAVMLAIIVPLLVLEAAGLWALFGSSLIPPSDPGVTPEELSAFHQHQFQMLVNLQRWLSLAYPLVGVIFYGLFAGANAFAYRTLTASDRSAEAF
jgi:hypothetical protein